MGPLSACEAAVEARRFAEAIPACTLAFERTGRGEAAAAAAVAYLGDGKRDEAWRYANEPAARDSVRARRVRGVVLNGRRDVEGALTELRGALTLALEQNDRAEAARAAHALGGIKWLAGEYSKAYEYIEIAAEQAERANDGPALALAEIARGDVFRYLGDAPRAELRYQKALEASAQWPREQTYAAFKLGVSYLERGETAFARLHLERALELADQSRNSTFTNAAHLQLARALIATGELDSAERHFEAVGDQANPDVLLGKARLALSRAQPERALELLERIDSSQQRAGNLWQLSMLRGRASSLAGHEEASVLEWSAAISQVELLSASEPEHQGWVTARRREPFDALFAWYASRGRHEEAWEVLTRYVRAEALLQGSPSDADPRKLLATAEAMKRDWRGMADDSAEAAAPTSGRAWDGREVLVVHEAEARLWVGVRRASAIRFVDAGRLEDWRPLVHRVLGDPADAVAAAKLGEALWAAAQLEPGPKPLFIVATGRLRRLPFPALLHAGRFWIDHRPLARLTSLEPPRSKRSTYSGAAVVVGDPFGNLPQARKEVELVARQLGATALVGASGRREAILRAQGVSVLHIATHSETSLTGAELHLSDGDLSATDVLKEQPTARVVVLASCASAVGREASGSDSLANAFLRAGSGAVVATLQTVPDDAARRVVEAFYRGGGATDPVGALARAQREVRSELPVTAWSSFVVSVGPPSLDALSNHGG